MRQARCRKLYAGNVGVRMEPHQPDRQIMNPLQKHAPSAPIVVSLSGGKESTAILLLFHTLGIVPTRIIHFDGGWEWPEMIEHIDAVSRLTGFPVETIRGDYSERVMQNGWPTPKCRWCIGAMRKAICEHARQLGIGEFHNVIGIAADEAERATKTKNAWYPLIAWGVTQAAAASLCYQFGLDWNGLYKWRNRSSCFCCPLQRNRELYELWHNRPELWERMKAIDDTIRPERRSNGFRNVQTLDQWENRFHAIKADEDLRHGRTPFTWWNLLQNLTNGQRLSLLDRLGFKSVRDKSDVLGIGKSTVDRWKHCNFQCSLTGVPS